MDKPTKKIKKIIKEIVSKVFKCDSIKITPEIRKFVEQFDSSEELLRNGGIPTDILDTAAFGFNENTIKKLYPDELHIKWNDDLENVRYELNHSKLTPLQWAKKINLSEPIEVSYENLGKGNKFYIEDGHHRYYAAKILHEPLNVDLKIKINPIKELSNNKLGYDELHRCLFDRIKKLSEIVQNDNEYKQITIALNNAINSIKKQYNCKREDINNGFCVDFVLIASIELDKFNINFEKLSVNDFFDIYQDDLYPETYGWNIESLKKYNSLMPINKLKQIANKILENESDHQWLFIKNKHYDSSDIDGKNSFWNLNFFKKIIK